MANTMAELDSDDIDARLRHLRRQKERLDIEDEEDQLRALQKSRGAQNGLAATPLAQSLATASNARITPATSRHSPQVLDPPGHPTLVREADVPRIKSEIKGEPLETTPPPKVIDLGTPSPQCAPQLQPENFTAEPMLLEAQPPISAAQQKRTEKFSLLTNDPDYSTIVQNPKTGQWVELCCPECGRENGGGGNSGFRGGKLVLFRGVKGFRIHLKVSHSIKYAHGKHLGDEETLQLCTKTVLTQEQVNAVLTKDETVYSITKVLVQKADGGSFVHKKRPHEPIAHLEDAVQHSDGAGEAGIEKGPANLDDSLYFAADAENDAFTPSRMPPRTLTMETRHGGVPTQNHATSPRKSLNIKTRKGGKKRSWRKDMDPDEVLFSDDDPFIQEVTAMQEILQSPMSKYGQLENGRPDPSPSLPRGASVAAARGKRARMVDDMPSKL